MRRLGLSDGPRRPTRRRRVRQTAVANGKVVSSTSTGSGPGVSGAGPPVTQVREGLDGFDHLDVSAMCDVSVTVGSPETSQQAPGTLSGAHPFRRSDPGREAFRVRVTAQENLQRVFRTVVRERTLFVETHESYTSTEPVHVEVQMPLLVSLSASGHGSVNVGGIHGPSFTLGHSGMGVVYAEGRVGHLAADLSGHGVVVLDLPARSAVINHSGMGSLRASGETESLAATLSGHGRVDLSRYPTPYLHLMASGMGTVAVCCTGAAKGQITSMGPVLVHGHPPDWRVRQDGMGSVRFV